MQVSVETRVECEMVKVPAAKPHDLNFILQTHMVEGKNWSYLWSYV